jgi:hypothetical protein
MIDQPRLLSGVMAVRRFFESKIVVLALAIISLLSSQRAGAEPEPVPSTPSTPDHDSETATEPAVTVRVTEPPPPPPDDAKASAIWAERPIAGEDAKHPPILAVSPQSDETEGTGARRAKAWTLSLALAHDSLSGDDFDDSQVLVRQEPGYGPEVTVLPELGSGSGFSIGLGYGHFPDRVGSFGIWTGLSYSATWLGVSSRHTLAPLEKAILHDLDFPLRVAYRVSRHFVPHFEVSYGFGFLEMAGVHGSVDEGTVWLDGTSTMFLARLLGAGVGALFPLNENVSIDAFVGYRVMVVSSIDGVELDDALTAGGWMLKLGPALFF